MKKIETLDFENKEYIIEHSFWGEEWADLYEVVEKKSETKWIVRKLGFETTETITKRKSGHWVKQGQRESRSFMPSVTISVKGDRYYDEYLKVAINNTCEY